MYELDLIRMWELSDLAILRTPDFNRNNSYPANRHQYTDVMSQNLYEIFCECIESLLLHCNRNRVSTFVTYELIYK